MDIPRGLLGIHKNLTGTCYAPAMGIIGICYGSNRNLVGLLQIHVFALVPLGYAVTPQDLVVD